MNGLVRRPGAAALLALLLLVALGAALVPGFATAANLWNVLWQASGVVLVAVGMTLVVATGGVDLSVGSVMAIAAAVAATHVSLGLPAALALSSGSALLVGLVNGWLVAREKIQPIVVTLATLIGGRGLAQVLSRDGQLVPIDDPAFTGLGRASLAGVPLPVLVAALVALAAWVALRRAAFGRRVLAVGGSPAAARLAGVPVTRTLVLVYALAALLAALAGVLEAARLGASDAARLGLNVELDAIAATVLGGTRLAGGRASIGGTVAGALVMQTIATGLNMLLVPYAWSLAIEAAIILGAVALQRRAAA